MSRHVLLKASGYRSMPWRNGLGTTREIAVEPPGKAAGEAGFRWRLSIADIERDCEFSAFPGINRSIMLLDGKGMDLFVDGQCLSLDRPFRPRDFSGDASARCRLHAGPVRDFNIMSAATTCRHEWRIVEEFPFPATNSPATQCALVCLKGMVNVRMHGESLRLESEDTLLPDASGVFEITTDDSDACVLLVRFRDSGV